jgi:quercetin dioxygenase-like cupin family protein
LTCATENRKLGGKRNRRKAAVQRSSVSKDDRRPAAIHRQSNQLAYERWTTSLEVPIYRGFHIEDLRTIELGWWPQRGCKTAFIQLAGQEGVVEARVTEIPPGETLPAWKFVLDEAVYVLEGRGLTTVWASSIPKKSFEWQSPSLFLIPRGCYRQFSNVQGDRPVRLLHYNYLPVAMTMNPDPRLYFELPYECPELLQADERQLYSVAARASGGRGASWRGNLFTDLARWDQLVPHRKRGGGGHVVDISFPNSEMNGHMSVFPPGTYKKGHRHGPGTVITIPSGEGYSILWPEGGEKVIVPWHEASMFVPPNRWFHQHFNVSATPVRYLALHPMPQVTGGTENVEDLARDQIEYSDEEPWIREKFTAELAKRGLKSLMPDEAYRKRDFQWSYRPDEEEGAQLPG